MRRPDLFQADTFVAAPQHAQHTSERDAVWERKREAFLQNQRAPASPHGSKKNERVPPVSSQFGDDWAKNVHETTKRQQDDYKPKIKAPMTKKTNGYCVRMPPGGVSSLDLGHSAPQTGANAMPGTPPAPVQNSSDFQRPPTVQHHVPASVQQQESAQRVNASPYAWDTPVDQGRRPPQQQKQQVAPYAEIYPQRDQAITANIGHSVPQAPFGTSAPDTAPNRKECRTNDRLPPYAEVYPQREKPITANVGHGVQCLMKSNSGADLHGHSFGAQHSQSSSNAFASGSRQNTGNVLTDRSTTRVVAPPGGFSSISFC